MKERTALILVFTASVLLLLLVLSGLSLLGASSELMAVAYVFLLCAAADTGVRVALRYRR